MTYDDIAATIEKYSMLHGGETLVIGLSGGADSVCLTSVLTSLGEKYSLKLIAAHVNHGIRGDEAKRDEEFCEKFCASLGLKLEVLHADVPTVSRELKMSEEECGRKIRYEFFSKLAGADGKIATAHNLNDSAETVIFNITRGTGIKGLCGIAPTRDNIIRPLIETPRSDIELYCRENSLEYMTDSTNLCNDYSRNKIRNKVLPVLYEINPSAVKAFSRLIESARDDEEYLSLEASAAYEKCVENFKLCEKDFSFLPISIKRRVAAMFVKSMTESDVSLKHIDDFLENINSGNIFDTAGGLRLRSRGGFIEKFDGNEFNDWSLKVKKENSDVALPFGTAKIQLTATKDLQNLHKQLLDNYIDCDKIGNTLIMRNRREGDSFTFYKRHITKTLKKLFNEDGIAPEKRNSVAVLASPHEVVWVEGYGVSEKYRIGSDTKKIMDITIIRGKKNEYDK